jgi:hypothetical protein
MSDKFTCQFVVGFVNLDLIRSLAILANFSFHMATKDVRDYAHFYVGWMPSTPA